MHASQTTTATSTSHGTYARYQKHIRERTQPCAECSAAAASYQRQWRADRARGVHVPAVLLAALYANAPIDLQEITEQVIGTDRLDHYVARLDAGEVIAA